MKRRACRLRLAAACALALCATAAHAGAQQYEPMSASVRASLHSAVSDQKPPTLSIKDPRERERWLGEMSRRLARYIADENYRHELLISIHYEATRAGLDPQLVLALIQVESAFRKYAISSAGARGYMQVMPFWIRVIGEPGDNLFFMRKNLRYGCTILRHYLDIEKGDLFRALGRYNGSLGRAEYPNLVRRAWENNWSYVPLPPAPENQSTTQETTQTTQETPPPASAPKAAQPAPAQKPVTPAPVPKAAQPAPAQKPVTPAPAQKPVTPAPLPRTASGQITKTPPPTAAVPAAPAAQKQPAPAPKQPVPAATKQPAPVAQPAPKQPAAPAASKQPAPAPVQKQPAAPVPAAKPAPQKQN